MIHFIETHWLAAIGVALFSLLVLLLAFCLCRMASLHDEPVALGAGSQKPTDELAIQERTNALAWAVFHAVALWSSVSYWLRVKRICKWHEPAPIRIGGNPFARQVTHGMCPECAGRWRAEVEAHEPELAGRSA